jgi:hypothetical protein
MICTADTFSMIERKGNWKELTEREGELTGSNRLGMQVGDGVVAGVFKSSSRGLAAAGSSSGRWPPAAAAARAPPVPTPSHDRAALVIPCKLDGQHSGAAAVASSTDGGRRRGEDSILSSSVG